MQKKMLPPTPRVALLLLVLLLGCDRTAEPRQLLVLAAASAGDGVRDLAAAFERDHGVAVDVSVGASNQLATQAMRGAPADVLVLASARWADAVQAEIEGAQRRDLLTNRLVVIVPAGNPANVRAIDDLLEKRVGRVALAGQGVPAGAYAQRALESLDLYQSLAASGRLVRGGDVRSVLAFVERGEVGAGLVYASDARISGRVQVVAAVDPAAHGPIVYTAILLSPKSPDAQAFYEMMAGERAAAVWRGRGLEPMAEAD